MSDFLDHMAWLLLEALAEIIELFLDARNGGGEYLKGDPELVPVPVRVRR